MNIQDFLEKRIQKGKHQAFGFVCLTSISLLDGIEVGLIPIIVLKL